MNFLLDFFYPKRCELCKSVGGVICKKCWSLLNDLVCEVSMPLKSMSIDKLMFVFEYQGVVKLIIKAFKFKGRKDLSPVLGHFVRVMFYSHLVRALDLDKLYLIPVPIDKTHLKERGFNQSKLLAKEIAKVDSRLKVLDCLRRTRSARAQSGLGRRERMENVKNLFAVESEWAEVIRGGRVVIVDDVATTMSTLKECARVLRNSGAQELSAIVLAKG